MISSHILPTLLKNRTNSQVIRIWSAACSSGQEPYTLAMMLRTVFPAICESRFRITGTDLSSDMIERAKRGQYSQLEVNRGVPVTHIIRHFKRNGLDWFLNDDIRRMVDFRTMNLSRPWPPMPLQDLVLIRNVMIYFDVDTRKRILSQIARVLAPDGFLILGASETPLFTSDVFERVCMGTAAAYRLKPDRAVAH
jgi:chemotaxis protein methyltransferase CheR